MTENQEQTPKISVIIPIYNTEQFLSMSIESVRRQTFKNIEIILVDDGSTDNSKFICEEYCRKDRRVQLFSQDHRGTSAARNLGLDVHTGEYVFFMDSDDIIHPYLLEQYVSCIRLSSPDFIYCSYTTFITLQEPNEMDFSYPAFISISSARARELFHYGTLRGIGGKLIRSQYIGSNRFKEEIDWGEDALFIYELLLKKGELAFFNIGWYYWRKHPGSADEKIKSKIGEKAEYMQRIRDHEYFYMPQYDNAHFFALQWEKLLVKDLLSEYISAQKRKNALLCDVLRNQYITEIRHPLFKKLPLYERAECHFCFHSPFVLFNRALLKVFDLAGKSNRYIYMKYTCKKPVSCVPQNGGSKRIALTFDATFGTDNVNKILQILEKYGVKATFFVSGIWAEAFPQELLKLIAGGNEVGNHSDTHPHFTECETSYIEEEIENCNKKIKAVTGKQPMLIRCPYGDYDKRVLEIIEQMKMKPIQWSVNSEDWMETATDEDIYHCIISKIRPGDIILFHNTGVYTPAVLEKVLPDLINRRYKFTTVSELLATKVRR